MKDFGKILFSLAIVVGGFLFFIAPANAQTVITVDNIDFTYEIQAGGADFYFSFNVEDAGINLGQISIYLQGRPNNLGPNINASYGGVTFAEFFESNNPVFYGNWRVQFEDIDGVTITEISFNVPDPNQSTSIWGSAGIWGDDFETRDVGDTLTASVQNTGANLWPLLIFSGVALAFIIFLQVVFLTKKSIKPARKNDFDIDKFNAKADELQEFYSRTGGAKKEDLQVIRRKK